MKDRKHFKFTLSIVFFATYIIPGIYLCNIYKYSIELTVGLLMLFLGILLLYININMDKNKKLDQLLQEFF